MREFYENIGSTRDQPISEMLDGFTPAHQQARESRVMDAARLWLDCIEGRQDPYFLNQAMKPTSGLAWQMLCKEYPHAFREAMTTSDFSALTADVLDRELWGYYTAVPIPNLGVAKKATLRDFRNKKIFLEDGMVTPFGKLGEFEVYSQRTINDSTTPNASPIQYYPDVYSAGAKISWRAIINDDLGIFKDIPQRLALGAQRTIHKFITTLYTDVNGPHASLFKAAAANLITPTYGAVNTNPSLSFAGLADGLTVLMRQIDSGGDPILIPGSLYLVVGPALWATAKNLLNQLTTEVTILGGDAGSGANYPKTKVQVNNWIIGNLILVHDPYMRIVASSASGSIKDTMWMLIADPGAQARPALEIGYLTGYDTPQLFQKQPNTMRIAGGVDPMMGDFYTMATEMKSIVSFGGTQGDGRSAVASTGANA